MAGQSIQEEGKEVCGPTEIGLGQNLATPGPVAYFWRHVKRPTGRVRGKSTDPLAA
jgi:hypothetical protein